MMPFITFRDKDKNGNLLYYILQRDFPHYVGLLSPYPIEGVLCQSAITGHSLWIVFNGTLRGNMIPSHKGEMVEMQVVFDNMAVWFHSERILLDEKRYKKFKIISNGTIANEPNYSKS